MKIIVYCRYPELGKVKTRLAADCGEQGALAVYKKLLSCVFQNIEESGYPFEVHCAGGSERSIEEWLQGMSFKAQIDGDLGDKLQNSVREYFQENKSPLVIIGSDQKDINKPLLEETELKLKSHDVVIGPAKDGGYYLIALKKAYLGLFENISWSTSAVLSETIQKIQMNGLSYCLLEEKVDIDHLIDVPEDWKNELRLDE